MARRGRPIGTIAAAFVVVACSCRHASSPDGAAPSAQPQVVTSAIAPTASVYTEPHAPTPALASRSAPATGAGEPHAAADAGDGDASRLHREGTAALLDLVAPSLAAGPSRPWLERVFGSSGPALTSQGHKALSVHAVSRARCLEGLRGTTLQTPAQRSVCGADSMVPIAVGSDKPAYCIDVFEFPNVACELPMVWVPPPRAQKLCELQGKRLCDQREWNLACSGDPEGGPERRYAYGERLDLDACHTRRPKRVGCSTQTAQAAWASCGTDTEPSGAFPRCRSRFGVYDQHGNVAEVMTRTEKDGSVMTQLKGSAWFYEQVSKEAFEPAPPGHKDAYPDHCAFDPRWHVEPLARAQHVNYHLGFRCCKSVR